MAHENLKDLIMRVHVAREQHAWSPQTAATFEKEALNLRLSDLAEGDTLLGIIASANRQLPEMHKRFRNALAIREEDPAILRYYGLALYENGLFSQAVQVLQAAPEDDSFASEVMALSCLALGLSHKAKQYYLGAGHTEEDFQRLCATKQDFPESEEAQKGFAAVYESFDRDYELWKSLSMR